MWYDASEALNTSLVDGPLGTLKYNVEKLFESNYNQQNAFGKSMLQ